MDHSHCAHVASGAEAGLRDPVCGMRVDPAHTPHRHAFGGRDFFFCAAGCRDKFAADPAKYADGAAARRADTAPEGAIYTCPMHPEVRQVGPGHCPICGMALEPEAGGAAEADDNGERRDMVRRLWISALLAAPVVALDMGGHVGGHVGGHTSVFGTHPPYSPGSSNSHSPRRSCCGAAGHSSCAAPSRWSRAISTCSR